MSDYFLVEADLVHNEVDHVLVEADLVHDEVDHVLVEPVGVHEAVRHTDDHFLHLYVEVAGPFHEAAHFSAEDPDTIEG